jgi:segregation and condensation protein B
MRIPLDTDELKAIVEALVFASDSPLRLERIAEIVETEKSKVSATLDELLEEYRQGGRGFVLVEVAGGFQFRTRPEHGEWLRRLSQSRPFRFTRAALETMAIVAYRQPITRAEIDYLRGVDSGGVLKTLLEKRLIRILGKKDIPGKPLIYGTTRDFLELFGLKDLSGLPTLKGVGELPETMDEGFAGSEVIERTTMEG